MKFSKKYILIALALFLIIAQFFKIDKTNPEATAELDFIQSNQVPSEIATMLKASCYDCHSNETKYPWYTDVAPISWFVKGHINNGREHLNFSEWGNYTDKKKTHKMEECVEVVYEMKSMPMLSYTIMHGSAKLNDEKRKTLADWFAKQ